MADTRIIRIKNGGYESRLEDGSIVTFRGKAGRLRAEADALADGYVPAPGDQWEDGERLFVADEHAMAAARGRKVVDAAVEAWRVAGVSGKRTGPRPDAVSVMANLEAGLPAYRPLLSDQEVEQARREALGDQGREAEDRERFYQAQSQRAADIAGARAAY